MKEKLYNLLITFGYPVFVQGTLNADDPYPNSFITYWINDVSDGEHYDNDTISYVWDFSIMFYSNEPTLVNSIPEKIRLLLKDNGFIPQGKGQDIPSDEKTHTGWAQDYLYLEY